MTADPLNSLEVVTVPPELSLEAAHRIMMDRVLRHLPVVSGQKLAGILSERDLLLAIGRAKDGHFVYPRLTVGEVMSLAPVSAGPNVPVAELARTMVDARLDAIPVVSPQNVLIGLVTASDLLRLLAWLPSERQPALEFQVRLASELQARA